MSKARDATFTSGIQRLIQTLDWYHSLRLPSGELIEGLLTEERLKSRIAQFPIPEDLTGMRVLDIGAWDGWFTFEMERRGAEVVAIDLVDDTNFRKARELMGSKAEYYVEDITFLTPEKYGYFDIVLFFGVLYHLKHPMLALERVCELSRNLVCVESFVSDEVLDGPVVMEFYEGDELAGQFDNWCGPSLSCLMAMCRTAGFAEVTFHSVLENRAHVSCQRLWENTAIRGKSSHEGAPPQLLNAENPVFHNHSFQIERDDYVAIWFRMPEGAPNDELTADDVYVQVGPYGIRPAGIRRMSEDGWQASVKVPLGLARGWYDVSVAIQGSQWSNALPIPVGRPAPDRPSRESNDIAIDIVTDGKTWERNVIHRGPESCISVWVSNLPDAVKRDELFLELCGSLHPVSYVSGPDPEHNGARQLNALLPTRLPLGSTEIAVVLGETRSAARQVEVVTGSDG